LSEIRMDEWGLDALAIGSQKGLMSPPGLGLAVLAESALGHLRPAGYYLDLARELGQQRGGQTAYTPAINLVASAAAVLEEVLREGLDEHLRQKSERNNRFYEIGVAAGLQTVPQAGAQKSPATAAFYLPKGATAGSLVAAMSSRGWRVAGGQGPLKGRIFRISAMGYLEDTEMERAFTDFESALKEL